MSHCSRTQLNTIMFQNYDNKHEKEKCNIHMSFMWAKCVLFVFLICIFLIYLWELDCLCQYYLFEVWEFCALRLNITTASLTLHYIKTKHIAEKTVLSSNRFLQLLLSLLYYSSKMSNYKIQFSSIKESNYTNTPSST